MAVTSEATARGPGAEVTRTAAAPGPGGVIAAIAVAAGVGCFFFTRSEMWLDEALSVNVARLPLADIPDALRHDGAPPLYYALLHAWTGIFGEGNLAARSLSGFCMAGALVALWFAGRRIGSRATAGAAVLLAATNPFAIRYATEARMYALEILLVAWGIVAFRRAVERPSIGRLATFGLLVALLAYTQYWALYLLAVVGVLLVGLAWKGSERTAARRMLIAFVVGAATFAAWLPIFRYQNEHTGTPWGEGQPPGVPIGETFLGFAGGEYHEGWLLLFPLVALILLGVFGRAVDGTHIDVDLRTVPDVRWEAGVGAATLVVGTSASFLADSAFEPRYSAVVFPFFVLVAARGVTSFADRRVRVGVLGLVVALGFVGAARNALDDRTQAGDVAAVLRTEARSGDVVLYCPDQLGPPVHRLAPEGLDEVVYPNLAGPERVDWVDYVERVRAADPAAVARDVLERAGSRTIWLVTGPGYSTHAGLCEAVHDTLAATRSTTSRVLPDPLVFEKPGLVRFDPR